MYDLIRYTIPNNIGSSFEWLIIFLVFMGGMIFYANDYKIGTILHFLGFGLTFIWFYTEDLNWRIPLVLSIIFFIIMSLSLYTIAKTESKGVLT